MKHCIVWFLVKHKLASNSDEKLKYGVIIDQLLNFHIPHREKLLFQSILIIYLQAVTFEMILYYT